MNPKDFRPFSPTAWITRESFDGGACLQWPEDSTAGSPLPRGVLLPDVPVW